MVQTIPCRNETVSYIKQMERSKPGRRKVRRVLNRRGILALAGTATAFLTATGGIFAVCTAQSHTVASLPVVSVPFTVGRGDSLWLLASRYGNPNASILDRVDSLAKANEMPTGSKLVPGQRLLIPVSNPVELARLPQNPAFTTTAQATRQ